MLIKNEYEWSTHQPAIKAVMDLYAPKYVLELGCGVYSTPLFLGYDIVFKCIESNKAWIDIIKGKYDFEPMYHEGIDESTNYRKTNRDQREKICKFYESIEITGDPYRLLFVDQSPSCRLISINTLKRYFDIIIYHDCDAAGIEDNSYDLINRTDFNSYVLETPMTGTGIMIRKEIDAGIDKLNNAFMPHVYYFRKEHPECAYMRLKNG